MYTDVHQPNGGKMIKSNRIDFNDTKIASLPYKRKLFTSNDIIRANFKETRLKLRVSENAKSFCVWMDEKRITLGQFNKSYGVANATADVIKLLGGDAVAHPKREERKLFSDLAEQIFTTKENRGKKFIKQERRKFRKVPETIVSQPIHKIKREDVVAWKNEFLIDHSPTYWNKVIEVPTNIWNVASEGLAFSLLENRKNPFAKLKEEIAEEDKTIYPVPSFEQIREIWKVVNDYGHPELALITKMKILTGMHTTEILQITDDVVNEEWMTFKQKIGVRHKIWLHPLFRKLIINWLKVSNTSRFAGLLFSKDGLKPIDYSTFNKVWLRATRKANLNFRFDRLRDTLITQMKETGFKSSYITGHCYKEDVQAKHYTDWDSEKMRNIFKETNKYWQSKVFESVKDICF